MASVDWQHVAYPEGTAKCSGCRSGGRGVVPAWIARPHLHPETSNPPVLTVCQDCGSLWVGCRHKPHAPHLYLLSWPYSHEFWAEVSDREDGELLNRWIDFRLRELWPVMSAEDHAAVLFHLTRSGLPLFRDEARTNDVDPLIIHQPPISTRLQ